MYSIITISTTSISTTSNISIIIIISIIAIRTIDIVDELELGACVFVCVGVCLRNKLAAEAAIASCSRYSVCVCVCGDIAQ